MFGIVGGNSTGPLANTEAQSFQPSVGSVNYIKTGVPQLISRIGR